MGRISLLLSTSFTDLLLRGRGTNSLIQKKRKNPVYLAPQFDFSFPQPVSHSLVPHLHGKFSRAISALEGKALGWSCWVGNQEGKEGNCPWTKASPFSRTGTAMLCSHFYQYENCWFYFHLYVSSVSVPNSQLPQFKVGMLIPSTGPAWQLNEIKYLNLLRPSKGLIGQIYPPPFLLLLVTMHLLWLVFTINISLPSCSLSWQRFNSILITSLRFGQ